MYIYDISSLRVNDLTLILLTWRKWTSNHASKWQMGFNSAFKGLNNIDLNERHVSAYKSRHLQVRHTKGIKDFVFTYSLNKGCELHTIDCCLYSVLPGCHFFGVYFLFNLLLNVRCILSFRSLSHDRSKASSKASSPHSAIQSFLLQIRVSCPFHKVFQ